ncbi:cbb3-type cytochrome c oxidase subunit 3 [Sulfitobacter sp. EhC04]|uniref:cbb3-type cytochrome c oxidase subunit 3 n=1 Tax=Sulfitobacter sp. EhC04 TaxID=1849168 RepID=UPI0009EE8666|nr:cbb3-type cytochrome c oxidase subunit 3 [Sulfitobacter sp. EhC04]
METYSLLREIADSWVLLAMFGFFLGAGIWAYLPSQSGARQDASMIPFRNDQVKAGCKGTCATCACEAASYNFEDQHNV